MSKKKKAAEAVTETEKPPFECNSCGKTWRGHDIFCPENPAKCEAGYAGAEAGHKWEECVCFAHSCYRRKKVGECEHEWSDMEFDGKSTLNHTSSVGKLVVHSCIKCPETHLSVFKHAGVNSFTHVFRLTPLREL